MLNTTTTVTSAELFNLLQAQKNWPSGGAPVLLDARAPAAYAKRMIRGALRAACSPDDGALVVEGPSRRWPDQVVCVYGDADAGAPAERAVLDALRRDGRARGLLLLSEPFEAFRRAFPFLTARGESSKAAKRPAYPSCVVPGLLYLGDLADASALGSLREALDIQHAVTALAELPPSLKDSVAESKIKHTWCNVRDVEGADIKEHFETAFAIIEAAREAGTAVLVHCSRGVSRSASLCIAYLMRKERWGAQAARDFVSARRPIVLPNDGFWRCLQEYEKELHGERSGVYAPAVTKTRLDDLEFELPPPWATDPTHTGASLQVEKADQVLETLPVGEHAMYTFGRSLTCDFQLEHPSASRMHAALCHHRNGGLYLIDLKSSHHTFVDAKPLRPYEACLLRDGSTVVFGASSRAYRVGGAMAAVADAAAEDDDGDGADAGHGAEGKRGRMHPKKWEKKRRGVSTSCPLSHGARLHTPSASSLTRGRSLSLCLSAGRPCARDAGRSPVASLLSSQEAALDRRTKGTLSADRERACRHGRRREQWDHGARGVVDRR